MFLIEKIWLIISATLVFFLLLPLVMTLLSLLRKERKPPLAEKETDFACIITAYKNAGIAIPLVESLLKQTHGNRIIYLVADDCSDLSEVAVQHPGFVLLKPEQKLSSKVKSMLYAVNNFKRAHEAIVVFDPDNLATPDFLSMLNNYLCAGFKAVQGKRAAKNLDTIYACGDATGELYKNYVERHAPYLLGSSAVIAGSGMAVETELFREYLNLKQITNNIRQNKVIAAEDKILQNFLVEKNIRIAFANDAILFDEKVATGSQVERQRSRWLFSYFENFQNALRITITGMLKFNFHQFLFGLVTIMPPLFILSGSALFVLLTSLITSTGIPFTLLAALAGWVLNIFLVLLIYNAPKAIWLAIWSLPLFVFRQFLGLLKMNRSRKDFQHTIHRKKVGIDEVISSAKG